MRHLQEGTKIVTVFAESAAYNDAKCQIAK